MYRSRKYRPHKRKSLHPPLNEKHKLAQRVRLYYQYRGFTDIFMWVTLSKWFGLTPRPSDLNHD